MRCLYCGKELALLKRWTGGGEFCSDAHRQQYQDEYNQLALNRLLQAKPPGENKLKSEDAKPEPAPASKTPELKPAPKPAEVTMLQPLPVASAAPTAVEEDDDPVRAMFAHSRHTAEASEDPAAEEPDDNHHHSYAGSQVLDEEEDLPPGEPLGFLVEIPVPAMVSGVEPRQPELAFESTPVPSLPRGGAIEFETHLLPAGRLGFDPNGQIREYSARRKERKLELRDFVRGAPVVEIDLSAAREVGLVDTSEKPMDILILPQSPAGSPPLWTAPEQGFSFDTELGNLARSVFPTTGFSGKEDNEGSEQADNELTDSDAPGRTQVSLAPAVEPAAPLAPRSAPVSPAAIEPVSFKSEVPAKTVTAEIETPRLEAQPQSQPDPEPQAAIEPEPVPVPEVVAEAAAEPEHSRVPLVSTKPLPLTLHGLAAGRGKAVQIFPSAVSTGVDIQVPRSQGLPLRPVMILGPAPAANKKEAEKVEEKKPVERMLSVKPEPAKSEPKAEPAKVETAKSESRKPQPRVETRFGNGKNRKSVEADRKDPERKDAKEADRKDVKETERKEPEVREVEKKAPAIAAEDRSAAAAAEKRVEKKPEPKPLEIRQPAFEETNKPKIVPPAAQVPTYNPPDLGLPSLNLQAGDSFFTRLPVVGKIGVAALVVMLIAGAIYFMTKGGGTSANTGPRVMEAGPALPAGEAGWITDWGAEPGVKRQHEISVLRPSMNLTDYRMEFQAQIETKALGWVYRAKDPKNYYVTRIEVVKPGLEPTVALVRYAVINGEEQPHAQFPLSLAVRLDTLYKIRFEAVGDKFTTWVQDQQMDEWTDQRIKTGGVGLYNLWGERMSLKGSVTVVPLVMKK